MNFLETQFDITIFKKDTGEIVSTKSVTAQTVNLQQLEPDEDVILGAGDNSRQYVRMPDRVLADKTPTVDLGVMKRRAIRKINDYAAFVRCRYITDTAGQAMIYAGKEAEAHRFIAALSAGDEIHDEDYPWLTEEVGITAPSTYELAQVWLNMAAIWRDVGSKMESARMSAIRSIDNATIPQVVEQAVLEFEAWAML